MASTLVGMAGFGGEQLCAGGISSSYDSGCTGTVDACAFLCRHVVVGVALCMWGPAAR